MKLKFTIVGKFTREQRHPNVPPGVIALLKEQSTGEYGISYLPAFEKVSLRDSCRLGRLTKQELTRLKALIEQAERDA